MRSVGRLMQHLGLFLPPIAMLLQLAPGNARDGTAISLGTMLMMLVAAVCLFFIGRILEGHAAK